MTFQVELNQEETMLIIRRLHRVLRPFLLRRLKKEVEAELPDKVRSPVLLQSPVAMQTRRVSGRICHQMRHERPATDPVLPHAVERSHADQRSGSGLGNYNSLLSLVDSSKDSLFQKKTGIQTLMNTVMQLRKLCNHPFIFEHIEHAIADHMGQKNKEVSG